MALCMYTALFKTKMNSSVVDDKWQWQAGNIGYRPVVRIPWRRHLRRVRGFWPRWRRRARRRWLLAERRRSRWGSRRNWTKTLLLFMRRGKGRNWAGSRRWTDYAEIFFLDDSQFHRKNLFDWRRREKKRCEYSSEDRKLREEFALDSDVCASNIV